MSDGMHDADKGLAYMLGVGGITRNTDNTVYHRPHGTSGTQSAKPVSDTPRTDAAEEYIKKLYHFSNLVSATKMRDLERENTRLWKVVERALEAARSGHIICPALHEITDLCEEALKGPKS